VLMTDHVERRDDYERPALTEYGTIEEWTQDCPSLVCVSIVLP
jgi:hypothetical protein